MLQIGVPRRDSARYVSDLLAYLRTVVLISFLSHPNRPPLPRPFQPTRRSERRGLPNWKLGNRSRPPSVNGNCKNKLRVDPRISWKRLTASRVSRPLSARLKLPQLLQSPPLLPLTPESSTPRLSLSTPRQRLLDPPSSETMWLFRCLPSLQRPRLPPHWPSPTSLLPRLLLLSKPRVMSADLD